MEALLFYGLSSISIRALSSLRVKRLGSSGQISSLGATVFDETPAKLAIAITIISRLIHLR